MSTTVLKHAWALYRKNFGVIAAVVLVVWLPLELVNSYMSYFVFDPDDFRKSFKLSQFFENFIGIIANAGIISIGYRSHLGQIPTFADAMSIGRRSWLRMWMTRLLVGLTFILGLILLVIPGIYLLVRLAFIEQIVVCERLSGTAAMRRSFELTKGRFWQMILLGLVLVAIMIPVIVCVTLPFAFIPVLDHWLVDAAVSLFADFIGAFSTLYLLCAYVDFSANQELAKPDIEKNPAEV